MNSHSISFDLVLEILSRLPAKSVARFRCVSKLWVSTLSSPYFTELFLTMSLAKPRLLFAVGEEEDGVWNFFSVHQLHNPYEKSSYTLVSAAEFQVKLSPGDFRIHPADHLKYFQCAYASGLIYFNGCHYDDRPLVCNPNTGRYVILPYLHRYRKSHSFLGFDPIDKHYKVLFMAYPSSNDHHKILTLGRDTRRWRTIECSLIHDIKSERVCINGVLYYLGDTSDWDSDTDDVTSGYMIVCFDVRSEKFTFIDVGRFCRLINYKEKLAVIFWEDDVDIYEPGFYWDANADTITELHVWIQEDVEKQEWSKYAYTWNDSKLFRHRNAYVAEKTRWGDIVFTRSNVSIAGATAWGEIVFAMRKCTSEQPFYVFYFNPEMNTLRRVEIQGFGETFKKLCSVWTFVNHVEDLKGNDLKALKSVHGPRRRYRYEH